MKSFKDFRQELTEAKLPAGHGSIEVDGMPHPNQRYEYHDDGRKNRDHYKKEYGIKAHALHSSEPGYYRVRYTGDKEKLRDFAHKHLDYSKKNHPTFDHLKHAIGKDQGDHE